jgi:hypothetical protein
MAEPAKNPTRLERAEAAFADSCKRREPPEDPQLRVLEGLMGRPSVTTPEGERRFLNVEDEFEHLRLWAVLYAASRHPLLEACSLFDVFRPMAFGPQLRRDVWQLRLRMRAPVPGKQLDFTGAIELDPREIYQARPDVWFAAMQMTVQGWLTDAERKIANELDAHDG